MFMTVLKILSEIWRGKKAFSHSTGNYLAMSAREIGWGVVKTVKMGIGKMITTTILRIKSIQNLPIKAVRHLPFREMTMCGYLSTAAW
ncbi:hypothetical protein D1872_291770 [compost metagenome]